jgi:hypothetical protein
VRAARTYRATKANRAAKANRVAGSKAGGIERANNPATALLIQPIATPVLTCAGLLMPARWVIEASRERGNVATRGRVDLKGTTLVSGRRCPGRPNVGVWAVKHLRVRAAILSCLPTTAVQPASATP